MPWAPDRYQQFQLERAAPFQDVVNLIEYRPSLTVVDLGCGTGELTQRLAALLPGSDVLGIDSSSDMLDRAAPRAGPGLRFERGDIAHLEGQWDVVFSHAAIHWLEGHQRLVPRLFGLLNPGGRLAVQLPSNSTHPSHQFILEIAAEEPFHTALGGWSRPSPVLSIDQYAQVLHDAGGVDLVVFEKVYPHLLSDADAVADWTSGTTMVPYFERLPTELHDPFMKRYRARLHAQYPREPVFYGFRRTIFAATRPNGARP